MSVHDRLAHVPQALRRLKRDGVSKRPLFHTSASSRRQTTNRTHNALTQPTSRSTLCGGHRAHRHCSHSFAPQNLRRTRQEMQAGGRPAHARMRQRSLFLALPGSGARARLCFSAPGKKPESVVCWGIERVGAVYGVGAVCVLCVGAVYVSV